MQHPMQPFNQGLLKSNGAQLFCDGYQFELLPGILFIVIGFVGVTRLISQIVGNEWRVTHRRPHLNCTIGY